MKYLSLIIIYFSFNTFAAPAAEVYMDTLKESNPQLAKALEIDGVDVIYQKCMSDGSSLVNGVVDGEKLMTCVWNDVEKNNDLKEQVIQNLKSNIAPEVKDEVASSRYQDKATMTSLNKNKSASLLALEKHLQKQLEDALYGERVGGEKNLYKRERGASQNVFFNLFKSQLGKNVINILSSYCIESEMIDNKYFLIPLSSQDQEIVKTSNIKGLAQTKTDASGNQILQSAATWNACVGTIQHHCYQTNDIKEMGADGVLTSTGISYSKDKMIDGCKDADASGAEKFHNGSCDDVVNYTVKRACEVTEYISRARKSLDANEKILAGMDKLNMGRDPTAVESYSDKNAKTKIDELTSLTSNQLVESGALAAAKEEGTEFENCYKDGAIQDAEACKDFLQTNRDEKLTELTEYKLNSEASIDEINKLTLDDEEKIQKILIEDGYNEADAKKLASNEDILKEIKNRYKQKEEALQKSVIDQINKITSKKEGEVTELDVDTLKGIESELKSKTKDFAKLVHYNNIVSSYLTITSEDEAQGKTTRQNTAMLQRELASNAFNDENLKAASEIDGEFRSAGLKYDQLDDAISKTGVSLDPGSDSGDSPSVQSADIVKSILGLFRTKNEDTTK